jgi:heterotetrameric sarcosine oxidase gamma subunit
LKFLDYLAANRIDQPIGKVVYTSLLTKNGGIKCDLTITRLAEDRFLVLTGGGTGMLDLAWLRQHAPADGLVSITDITSKYGALGLWGPKAREVLQSVCENDVSNEAFPYFTAQELMIETVPALALRVSYVGELGWEIYTPSEYGLRLWDVLWQAGQPHGIIAGGLGAFDSLRLEKGYRFWGADMYTEHNPYEAGLGWAVRLNKGDFLGRDALLKLKEASLSRKLCCMTLDEPDAVALGKEPIMDGNQKLGYVTSANYGYSIGKYIVYGYLPIEYAQPGAKVEVVYFGQRRQATVVEEPLYDPKGEKLRQ